VGTAGAGIVYRILFETPAGEVRWSVAAPAGGGGTLAVPVPIEALPEDDYIVRVQERRGDALSDVASYTFTLLTH
jgi:hypothetical protein